MDLENIVNIFVLLAGGGGVGGLLTWSISRRRQKAEADTAEAAATKEVQDIYQQMVADVKQDRDEQKQYISELKEDRRMLKAERDDLQSQIQELSTKVFGLEKDVARNGKMMESMRPFLCSAICPNRVTMSLSDVVKTKKPKTKKNDSSKEG